MLPFYSALTRHIWSPVSSPGFSRTRQTGTCDPVNLWYGDPANHPKHYWGLLDTSRSWESRGCSGWRKECSGWSQQCIIIPDGRVKKMDSNSSQQCPVIRQEAMATNWNINICINKRKLFHSEDSHTLEQVSQRGYKVSILGAIPNLTGQDPEQSALADSDFRSAVGLDYFLSCLPPSTILGLLNLPFWLIFCIPFSEVIQHNCEMSII